MEQCMCGADPGAGHDDDCPYPCFARSRAVADAWTEARQRKRQEMLVADAALAAEYFTEDELEEFAKEYRERGGAQWGQ